LAGLLLLLTAVPLAEPARAGDGQDIQWNPLTQEALSRGDTRYFNMAYNAAWADAALRQLGVTPPPAGSSRGDYAAAVIKVLQDRIPDSRQAARMPAPVPSWLIDGYLKFQPATVAKSRWMNDVIAGLSGRQQVNPKVRPDVDIAALYTYWCMYDAEWFNAARKPAYKAWLTAIQLYYPADWQLVNMQDKAELHERLVVPLQTKDEPYREIDNWLNTLKTNNADFAKPLVRRSLVEELLQRGGIALPGPGGKPQPLDQRLFADPAYQGQVPAGLGLSDQDFFVLAALCTEFSSEINTLQPKLAQLAPFAQYFIDAFEREK
jgi:hypothetical protein